MTFSSSSSSSSRLFQTTRLTSKRSYAHHRRTNRTNSQTQTQESSATVQIKTKYQILVLSTQWQDSVFMVHSAYCYVYPLTVKCPCSITPISGHFNNYNNNYNNSKNQYQSTEYHYAIRQLVTNRTVLLICVSLKR